MHVGVTGHQRLANPNSWPWVTKAMSEQLSAIEPPLIAITSLAIGADQLLARLVVQKGGKIHAVLPFADIERSFSAGDLPAYRELIANAVKTDVLNTPGTDEDAFLAAGRRVVELSDILMAVWNRLPAEGKGGTADIVAYAKSQRKPLIVIDPVSQTVEHSPRQGAGPAVL
jgi:hypothetical protein